jgi:hypothetical protein
MKNRVGTGLALILLFLIASYITLESLDLNQFQTATLTTNKTLYSAGETVKLTVTNYGQSEILTGYLNQLTRRLFFFWIPPIGVPWQSGAIAVGMLVPPGGQWSGDSIDLTGFPPGEYRVAKDLGSGFGYARFTVGGTDLLPVYTLVAALFAVICIGLVYCAFWRGRSRVAENAYDYPSPAG